MSRVRPSSGRSSLKTAPPPPVPTDQDGPDLGAPPPAAMDNGDDVPVQPAPRGPVAVGRSLEILTSPDVCMEQLVDKLKLVNYEAEFCRKKKPYRKPLSRVYFAAPHPQNNQAEQFFYFTSLTAWLLGLAGVDMGTPKEFDDPNTTTSNIMSAVKKLGFAPPSYHSTKLNAGWGKEVCGVLEGLVDLVLEKRNFTYKKPMYQPDAFVDEDEADEEGDAAAFEGTDEYKAPAPTQVDDEEEEAYMEPERMGPQAAAPKPAEVVEKQMLKSRVDPTLWRIELERVTPKLRITLNADSKDWRSHLEEAHQHQKTISTAWPDSKQSLEKLRGDLNNSLEKLMTREKFLNESFEQLMQQYRGCRSQLTDFQEVYNKKTEFISDRNNELHRITDLLDEIKHSMDERGSNIADATPVVRIKNAIKKLNEELHGMEVRIGVLSHTLLQLSIRNKRTMMAQAAAMSDEDDDL